LLDPKDQALLLDPAGGGLDFGRHHGLHAGATPPVAANVSWLRKTEYISRDSTTTSRAPAADLFVPSPPSSPILLLLHLTNSFSRRSSLQNDAVDVSREAQIVSIENSFAAARSGEQLSSLRHPTKPRVRAVAAYEVLPDADVWANAYDLFRFSERPGERGPEVRFCRCLPLTPIRHD
jgi:RNA polymerase II-associated factor 1